MILSAQSIRRHPGLVIFPFCERIVAHGMSYDLSAAGYDIRIKDEVAILPGRFALATTIERITVPNDLLVKLADKSSWARRGIAVQNTIFEPGWKGYPTLELTNHGREIVIIPAGAPIGQLIFHLLDQPTDQPYCGRYQDQPQVPTPAIDASKENVG